MLLSDFKYLRGAITAKRALRIGSAANPATDLPAGYGNSNKATGLTVTSSYPSDDVTGGTDGTGRINLYSYQRANAYSFGEVMRTFLMKKDAKAMQAYYVPSAGYNATTRDPNAGSWQPAVWTGLHWEANAHNGNHKHWEIEIPDSAGALQGRFEVVFGNQSDETIGLDKTSILTNLSDFVVRCHGTSTVSGADQLQVLRLQANAGFEKGLEFSNDVDGVGRRFKLRVTSEAETGSNAGANFNLVRYDDAGTIIDSPIIVFRSTGQVAFGGTSGTSAGVTITRNGGVALTVTPTATGGQAVQVVGADGTTAALVGQVGSEGTNRFRAYVDGKLEWGTGAAARDVNLYRSNVGRLKTDGQFQASGTVGIGTTPDTDISLTIYQPADKNALWLNNTLAGGTSSQTLLNLTAGSSTSPSVASRVTGDAASRFYINIAGQIQWGDGTGSRDATLYRSSAGVLKTDTSFQVTQNLRINTTSVGSGVGVIGMANATTLPAGTPSAGGVIYVDAGALKYKGSSGTVTTLAPA